MRYRLIKPQWGKKIIGNDTPNPKFVREINGPDTYEGEFDDEFLHKKNAAGYNIYYFPNSASKGLPDGSWMAGKHVDQFDWVFVDMDLKDKVYPTKEAFLERVSKFALKPTKVVDSGNGIHVYWKVADIDGDPVTYMGLQKSLIHEFNTDSSIWTPLQLMRAPGFKNTKDPDNFKEAKLITNLSTNKTYTVEEIASLLPELTEKDEADIQLHMDKLEGKVSIEIQESMADGLPKRFEDLLEEDTTAEGLFYRPTEIMQDRSSADMALANYLVAKCDFEREEVMQVMLHTSKALSKTGRARFEYAQNTVMKACRDRTPAAAMSAKDMLESPEKEDDLGARVNGPYFLDCLFKPWRKKQMLGLIAGSGVGKTSLSLKILKEFIMNNPDNDDVFFFFSLEMTAGEVLERWKALVGNNEDAYERLFVIGQNFFEKADMPPNIQSIYRVVRDTCRRTGKKPGVVIVDHIDALEGDFDLKVEPTFNAERSKYVERKIGKDTVILSKDGVCQKLKTLCQKLDTFLIVQSQTTKNKDDGGDQPIGKNAAFGTSKFEWYCDYVVGVWRPLNRVMDHCKERNLFVTAYQYAKMREQTPDKDQIELNEFKLIKFDPSTQDFMMLTDDDKSTFDELIETAIKLREVQEKKKVKKYTKAPVQRLRMLVNNAKAGK